MNSEVTKWQNLRSHADAILKQTLAGKPESQDGSLIAKALAVYAKSDHTIKTHQMKQDRPSEK